MTDGLSLPPTRTACVLHGAAPERIRAIDENEQLVIRANAIGTLVTGPVGALVIDYAGSIEGPVYDIMYSARTGWFSVTVYRGLEPPVRWDNRPGTDPGYPRVDAILGATSPHEILAALDVPASVLGYIDA
ncbi:MAG: hypothetical protein ABIY55_13350 [Kofleriaceae bacterium]